MDSGNSGSLQSSSTGGGGGGSGCGDDQEYDSRVGGGDGGGDGDGGESISAFFNPMSNFNMNNNMGVGASPLQLYSFSNGSSSFANQVSNCFDHPPPTLLQSNFMINHNNNNSNSNGTNNINIINNNQVDMVWPNKFGSTMSTDDANCTDHGYTNHHQQQIQSSGGHPTPVSSTAQTISGSSGRNPKKRSRASRRAPTTVLTTDTNNFRQMVQEFTGIPAPPFSTRARFDLFGVHSPFTPAYLLRPFAQRIPPLHQPPFLANHDNTKNSPLPPHTTTTNVNDNSLGLATMASTSTSTSLASTSIHLCDPQEYLSSNDDPQLITFQSLLQSTSSILAHHQNTSNNPTAGNYADITSTTAAVNGASAINEAASKGQGMLDSWICSSQ